MSEIKLTYRELQAKAKSLGIKAAGTRVTLTAKIAEAEEAQKPPKVNKRGKTPEQVKKNNNAAAALAACGRL